ncbi:MAG: hypothetical protein SO188_08780 [Prevotella sp.]|nr:hypothetical protein [Prevotella sp.]
MEGNIQKVLDTRGALRCVRFESGNVGVVTTQGKTKLVVGPFQELSFAENGFLRVFNRRSSESHQARLNDRVASEEDEVSGREFFIDMKNGELYAQMPEFVHFGDFEIANIGGYLCTRTKKLYEVKAIPAEAWHGKYGLYLSLPYSGEPEENIKKMMIWTPSRYVVCLLNGDESGVYWKMRVFEDYTLLVMDDQGNYYHVKRSARSRSVARPQRKKAVKVFLGQAKNEADRMMIVHAVREIEEQVADYLKKEATKAKQEAEKEREQQMATLVSAEPFNIGNKWGLRSKGRIVVPPVYRSVKSPVGRYCAMESYPGIWGVIAVDGKIEVEPRYEDVVIHTDGTVDLTVRPGKVITKKLP